MARVAGGAAVRGSDTRQRLPADLTHTASAALDELVGLEAESLGPAGLARRVVDLVTRHGIGRWAAVLERDARGGRRLVATARRPPADVLKAIRMGPGGARGVVEVGLGSPGDALALAPGPIYAAARRHVLPMARTMLAMRRAGSAPPALPIDRAQGLYDVLRNVEATAPLAKLVDAILGTVSGLIPFDIAALLVIEGGRGTLGILPTTPVTDTVAEEFARSVVAEHAALASPKERIDEVERRVLPPVGLGPHRARLTMRSRLSLPVILRQGVSDPTRAKETEPVTTGARPTGRLAGQLVVVSAGRAGYGAGDLFVVGTLAGQLGLLLESRRLLLELERQASIDEMTDLLNHRSFRKILSAEVSRARRHGKPLSVLMVDVDHFKRINDTLGHPAGDGVLRAVARLLAESRREEDVVARYGGEEFVIVLPETTAEGAEQLAERIRARIARTPLLADRPLTVSLGVACLEPDGGLDEDGLVAAADRALYAAKRGGRNRVVRAS